MHHTPSPVPPATIQHLETQLKFCTDVSDKVIYGIEQLFALNLLRTRALMQETNLAAREWITVREPQTLMALITSQLPLATRLAVEYANNAVQIVASTQAELALVGQRRSDTINRSSQALIGDLVVPAIAPEKVLTLILHALATAQTDWQQRYPSERRLSSEIGHTIIDVDESNVIDMAEQLGYQRSSHSTHSSEKN